MSSNYPDWNIIDVKNNQNEAYNQSLPNLLISLCSTLNVLEQAQIKEAYRISIEAHSTQLRKSGDPYITHIEAVSFDILPNLAGEGDISLTSDDIIVALLHDVLEDHPEYFNEIYQKFGYTVVYRILCLSKPSQELFIQWKRIIPQESREDIQKDPIYKLWNKGLCIEPSSDSYQDLLLELKKIVWECYSRYHQLGESQSIGLRRQLLTLMGNAQIDFYKSAGEIQGNHDLDDKKRAIGIRKKWSEFLASLQILMISRENLPVKFSDKIHNLSDTKYRDNNTGGDNEKMKRKTKSILKTVEIFDFLANYYGYNSWRVELSKAASISRTHIITDI